MTLAERAELLSQHRKLRHQLEEPSSAGVGAQAAAEHSAGGAAVCAPDGVRPKVCARRCAPEGV
jgi:hypothetical protein